MRRLLLPVTALAVWSTACGLVAFSTDDLSAGGSQGAGGGGGGGADGATDAPLLGADGSAPPDGATATDGSMLDGTSTGPEGGPDAKESCPANPCSGGQSCCYIKEGAQDGAWRCQASCPNGSTDCVGPQQCGAGAPLCCGEVQFGPGGLPNCPIDAIRTRCVATCTTNFGLSCNVTNTMRLCHEKADCASDPQNNNCCTFNGSGVSAIVCVSDLIRDFAGLLCLP